MFLTGEGNGHGEMTPGSAVCQSGKHNLFFGLLSIPSLTPFKKVLFCNNLG